MSRKEFVKTTAVGAAGVAAVVGAGGFLAEAVPATARAQTTGGSSVAWALGMTASTERLLVGFDSSGGARGQIDATEKLIVRSHDAESLYLVSARKSGATSVATIERYRAADGRLQSTITGKATDLGYGGGFDFVWPAISADDRYLAVFHQTTRITQPAARQLPKVSPTGSVVLKSIDDFVLDEAVEIFDLAGGTSLDRVAISSFQGNPLGGQVEFGLSNRQIYVVTEDDRQSAPAVEPALAAVGFDGQRLTLLARARDGENGHHISRLGHLTQAPSRVLDSGRTLVRLATGDSLQWFDLPTLQVQTELDVRPPQGLQAKGYPTAAVFSPDDRTLYLGDSFQGVVQAVDLAARAIRGRQSTGDAAQRSRSAPAGGFPGPQSLALSPDGVHLYFVDSVAGGLWSMDSSTLEPTQKSLVGTYLRAVWASPDGTAVFATAIDGKEVYVFYADGSPKGVVRNAPRVAEFSTAARIIT